MNIALAKTLVIKEFKTKYSSSYGGLIWFLIEPLVQLSIFTLVFSVFLGVRMEGRFDIWTFSLYLIPGIILWNFMQDVIVRLGNSIYSQRELIKKTPISLGTIFLSDLIYCSLVLLIYCVLFMVFVLGLSLNIGVEFNLSFYMLSFMLSFLLAAILATSIGIILAFITPFYNQLIISTQVIFGILFWFTPIVYSAKSIPITYQEIIQANPFYAPVSIAQSAMVFNEIIVNNLLAYGVLLSVTTIVLLSFIQRFSKRIREVL